MWGTAGTAGNGNGTQIAGSDSIKIERIAVNGSGSAGITDFFTTTFTISAVEGGYMLGLSLFNETTNTLISDYLSPAPLLWDNAMLEQELTGFALHAQSTVLFSSLQVSYLAIPEPATWALMLSGATLLLTLRRRR